MTQGGYSQWLVRPPLAGRSALLAAVMAVALPSLIRFAIEGVLQGCEFTPYLPFVFLSAILLRWWQAALVAAASVAVMGGMLMDMPYGHLTSTCFQASALTFVAGSAAMIAAAAAIRRAISALHARGADEANGGIVFSLHDNAVWATWYGLDEPVRLGSQHKVESMMTDFLAQSEAARRLNR
jgi:hypothetical protein